MQITINHGSGRVTAFEVALATYESIELAQQDVNFNEAVTDLWEYGDRGY